MSRPVRIHYENDEFQADVGVELPPRIVHIGRRIRRLLEERCPDLLEPPS